MRLDLAPMAIFQEKTVPAGTRPAGWAALVPALGAAAPVRRPACVSEQYVSGSRREVGAWLVFDKRYWPGETFADHLDRKSTRLNSSHLGISYAVFCLK